MILLADRGFGRCALAAFCRRHGLGYLIRIQPKVNVKFKGFAGKLLDYPVHKGIAKMLKDVAYRADGAVTQHVVVRWRRDLPKKRDECWFLMTDLSGTAHQLCYLYARRMTIEQLFRDHKSKRNGRGGLALNLGPARHATHHARPARPAAAHPRHRPPAAVRRQVDRPTNVPPVGLVLIEQGTMQRVLDRITDVCPNERQPASGIHRRLRAFNGSRGKVGIAQLHTLSHPQFRFCVIGRA